MRDVLLLDGPGSNDLARAVRTAGGPSCVVHRVSAIDELVDALRGDTDWQLALVPAVPAVLRAVRAADETVPLVAIAERGDVDLASAAIQAGASDLLVLGERMQDRVATLLAKVRPWVRLREGS